MIFGEVAESWVKCVNLDGCKALVPLSRISASAVLSRGAGQNTAYCPGSLIFN